jgi:ribosomal-protein-alanine acetyltransferase
LKIRAFEHADVGAVLEIQNLCPEIAQWSAWDYDRVACDEKQGSQVAGAGSLGDQTGWIAKEGFELTGFLVARRILQDLEILNFAVRPEARRQGTGSALLREALEWGNSFKAEKAFLEVRASNQTALKFYSRFGFEVTGRRPHYYSEPVEDALLLTANLPIAPQNQ